MGRLDCSRIACRDWKNIRKPLIFSVSEDFQRFRIQTFKGALLHDCICNASRSYDSTGEPLFLMLPLHLFSHHYQQWKRERDRQRDEVLNHVQLHTDSPSKTGSTGWMQKYHDRGRARRKYYARQATDDEGARTSRDRRYVVGWRLWWRARRHMSARDALECFFCDVCRLYFR